MTLLEKRHYQYEGFYKQPNLWLTPSFFEYPQIDVPFLKTISFPIEEPQKHQRLGKLVETFYTQNLREQPNYKILTNNLQIQVNKHQTLGELDVICETPTGTKHIELTYKFYLYKTDILHELDRWVGPNLKDSLVKKLNKLKIKQLPMLQHPVCQQMLSDRNINPNNIQQHVHFKAQLYVPLSLQKHQFPNINNACICGYYISHKEIDFLFPFALYQIPQKQDWLINPKHNTQWMSFIEIKPLIIEQIAQKHSPLIWIKRGAIYERLFVTFW